TTEVPAHSPPQEFEVLDDDGSIEAQLRPEPRDVRCGVKLSQHDCDGVARRQVQHQEGSQGDPEEGRDEQKEPPRQEGPHSARPLTYFSQTSFSSRNPSGRVFAPCAFGWTAM